MSGDWQHSFYSAAKCVSHNAHGSDISLTKSSSACSVVAAAAKKQCTSLPLNVQLIGDYILQLIGTVQLNITFYGHINLISIIMLCIGIYNTCMYISYMYIIHVYYMHPFVFLWM